nr:hypothetical protein [Tanacetum cinerariifolium]
MGTIANHHMKGWYLCNGKFEKRCDTGCTTGDNERNWGGIVVLMGWLLSSLSKRYSVGVPCELAWKGKGSVRGWLVLEFSLSTISKNCGRLHLWPGKNFSERQKQSPSARCFCNALTERRVKGRFYFVLLGAGKDGVVCWFAVIGVGKKGVDGGPKQSSSARENSAQNIFGGGGGGGGGGGVGGGGGGGAWRRFVMLLTRASNFVFKADNWSWKLLGGSSFDVSLRGGMVRSRMKAPNDRDYLR